MPLRPPVSLPNDIRSFSKWCQEVAITQAEALQADNASLLNSQPGSYYLALANATGTLADANIASTIARDTEVTAAIAAHAAAADPHTVYPLAASAETIAGAWVFSLPVRVPTYTVATLPAAATYSGGRANVSDANATTFAAVVAGGGANYVPVYSDGAAWRIG